MAAPNHRGSESDIVISRGDFSYSNEEYVQSRNDANSFSHEKGGLRDVRDKVKVRQKDDKKKQVIHGRYKSCSSRSDSSGSCGSGSCGPQQCGSSVKDVDKEPGELSSESGSDDAIGSESQIKHTEACETVETFTFSSPLEKKRKFSPIVWDRDEKEDIDSSRTRVGKKVTAFPLPPPLPKKVQCHSPNIAPAGGKQISPIMDSKTIESQLSSPVVVPSAGDSELPPLMVFFSSPVKEQPHGTYHEAEHHDDADYAPTRNISSSRWAAGNNSLVDEGEIVEDEMPKRRKKMMHIDYLEAEVHDKSLSYDTKPLKREESEEGDRARSSESDGGGVNVRSTSKNAYSSSDSEKDDYVEIDNDHKNTSNSLSHSDTETDIEGASRATPEPLVPPQRSINMLQGCRSVDEFERLNKIDEGTYGVVYRARDKKTEEIVALKKVKMEKEREGFPLTALREINILLSFHHPSIVDVKEVVVGSSLDSIFMVMEYMEHDLKGLMESMKQPFSQSEVKCLMLQLLKGVKYLHDNWVLHRDLKTSNLLLNNRGELKICDFGLSRQYGSPLKPYTHLVVTLWYRSPELLLGAKQYSTAIDMWSLGCIMAEMLSKEPLFNGKTEFDQLDKIFRILGTPNETIWPGFSKLPGVKVNFVKHRYNMLRKKFPATSFTGSPVLSDAGFDLLNKLLTYDPEKRLTAENALEHAWFKEVPLPKSKDFMPTFPAQHAQDRRVRRMMKSPDPLEEQRKKELRQRDLGNGGLFS